MSDVAVTRFAPSPTGHLHVGHAYSAIFGWQIARQSGGRFLLRIEDIDRGRCKPEFEADLMEDLSWLGLDWDGKVRRQSAHMDDYAFAIGRLGEMGVLYPCFCTRQDIRAEIAASGEAPHGPDGPLYPGICRGLDPSEREERLDAGVSHALRLDMARAARMAGQLGWLDRELGLIEARPERHGDVVLARKDTPTSYHLAVTLDDHLQGVTLVTRGADLFEATHVHRLLQALLGLDLPDYHHHDLLTDASGRRFAKRDRDLTIRTLREAGETPDAVRALAGI